MKVLFATAELAPLVRVGGLAEAAGGLTRALRAAGVEVHVVVPDYFATPLEDEQTLTLDVAEWAGPATARIGHLNGFGEVTLVTVPDIRRLGAYGDPGGEAYDDNDRRFIRFSAAVAVLARHHHVDVLHVNDWHTSAAIAFSDERLPTVVSIHNLAYQGWCDRGWLEVFGTRARAYDLNGSCNPLVGALTLADAIVAVSPTYAQEILGPTMGCGLHELLRWRGDALVGILNGIDTDEWNPATDPTLPAPFSAGDLAGKKVCAQTLRTQMGLDTLPEGPLIGLVSRLVDQKGIDMALEMIPYLGGVDAQMVVLGSGDRVVADGLTEAAATYPGRVAFSDGYDLPLSHRIFAGSDLYLMPSRFEPCGLAQMQAMAFGTLPVVTDVGGLHDTVIDADSHPQSGTGIVSLDVSAAGLVDALHRGAALYGSPARRQRAAANAMAENWSWAEPAQRYIEQYQRVVQSVAR